MSQIKLTIEGTTNTNELAEVLREMADRFEANQMFYNDEFVENDLVINLVV